MAISIDEEGGQLTAIISSEDDAWELLGRVSEGEFGDRPVIPSFRGWPDAELTFWIDDEHEVLTAPMMEALLSYQAGLYRAFLLVTEDTTNLRSLSDDDRREYEMRVKVGEGCTKLIPDWQALAEKFADKVVAHMTGTEITITVLGFALLFAGGSAWKAWLTSKAQRAADDARNENTRQLLGQQQFAAQTDLERMRLLTNAITVAMGTRALIDASDEGKQGILKAASKVDETDFAGVDIPSDVARKLAKNYAPPPEPESIEGLFRVMRTDADAEGRFRVKLASEDGELTFFAGIRDALLAGNDREVISEAEWTQTPFWGRIELQRQRGEISKAIVVQVEKRE